MAKILVVGSSNFDLVWRCPRLPGPGETVAGSSFATYTGGKGANQAVAAGRLGASVAFCGCVGEDTFGTQMLAAVEGAGVNVSFVRRTTTPSGTASVVVQEDGGNQIVVALGANLDVTENDVQRAVAGVSPQYVLTQLETTMEAVEAASLAGRVLVLNPAPATEVSREIVSRCFAVIPNETEITRITGEADQHTAARKLLAWGAKHVIVTLGAHGVAWYTDSGEASVFSAFVVDAVDTVAAGDVFCGAFVTALSEGADIGSSIRFASAAAAISVTRHGAQASCPTRNEVVKMLGQAN